MSTALFERRAGSGPLLVLVHGFGVSSLYFVPARASSRATSPVARPTSPATGGARSRGTLSVAELAETLLDWLDEPALVLANSFGCQVVLEAAARDPARLRGLVLVGPTYDPRLRLAQSAARLLRDAVREQPSLVRGITRDYLRMGPRRLLQTALAILATRCSRSCRGSRRRPSSSAGSVTRSSRSHGASSWPAACRVAASPSFRARRTPSTGRIRPSYAGCCSTSSRNSSSARASACGRSSIGAWATPSSTARRASGRAVPLLRELGRDEWIARAPHEQRGEMQRRQVGADVGADRGRGSAREREGPHSKRVADEQRHELGRSGDDGADERRQVLRQRARERDAHRRHEHERPDALGMLEGRPDARAP